MNNYDDRWVCWQCADIALLDDHGLCPACQPEPVLEWWRVMVRVVAGERVETGRVWRIG